MSQEVEGSSGRCLCCCLACAASKILCFSCFSGLCPYCFPQPLPYKPDFPVLCLGLSGAGKSTLLSILSGGDTIDIEPTIGFAIKAFLGTAYSFQIKELGGAERIRPYWNKYYSGHKALIFVVDSFGPEEELLEAKQCLEDCLSNAALQDIPVLFLCNKQDLAGAKPVATITDLLKLEDVFQGRQYRIMGSSCKNVQELREAIESLAVMAGGKDTEQTTPAAEF